MKLTDFESGIVFELDVGAFGATFDRGPYREVRTAPSEFFDRIQIYKVKETVAEIIRQAGTERVIDDV